MHIYNYIYIHNTYLLRRCLTYLYTLFIYLILYLCSCLQSSSLPNRQWAVKKTWHITNNVINAANGSSQLLQEFLHGDLLDGHKKRAFFPNMDSNTAALNQDPEIWLWFTTIYIITVYLNVCPPSTSSCFYVVLKLDIVIYHLAM